MTNSINSTFFDHSDRLKVASLALRQKRNNVIAGNLANAETPGFRALEVNFEEQLASASGSEGEMRLVTSNPKHFINGSMQTDQTINAEVFVQPKESISQDGNSVDVDTEMTALAENNILFRATVEMINRKIGIMKYAINGGR